MSAFVVKAVEAIELYDVMLTVHCEYAIDVGAAPTVGIQRVFIRFSDRAEGPDISSLFAASDKLLKELSQQLLKRHTSE